MPALPPRIKIDIARDASFVGQKRGEPASGLQNIPGKPASSIKRSKEACAAALLSSSQKFPSKLPSRHASGMSQTGINPLLAARTATMDRVDRFAFAVGLKSLRPPFA